VSWRDHYCTAKELLVTLRPTQPSTTEGSAVSTLCPTSLHFTLLTVKINKWHQLLSLLTARDMNFVHFPVQDMESYVYSTAYTQSCGVIIRFQRHIEGEKGLFLLRLFLFYFANASAVEYTATYVVFMTSFLLNNTREKS
jgi:hypothetical protein